MIKFTAKSKVFLILSFLLMIGIFTFSAQSGNESSGISMKVTKLIARVMYFDFSSYSTETQNFIVSGMNGFVRKLAHFSVYAFLGAMIFTTFHFLLNKIIPKIISSIIFCFIYASIDEIHQLFVPGRTGRILDVCIDTVGSITGIIFILIILSIIHYITDLQHNK